MSMDGKQVGQEKAAKSPEHASIFSRTSFAWVGPMLDRGMMNQIAEGDALPYMR